MSMCVTAAEKLPDVEELSARCLLESIMHPASIPPYALVCINHRHPDEPIKAEPITVVSQRGRVSVHMQMAAICLQAIT